MNVKKALIDAHVQCNADLMHIKVPVRTPAYRDRVR